MSTPNVLLRKAREALSSRRIPDECMSRSELADEVNRYLLASMGKRFELDRHQIARYERGEVRWPSAAYRAGLRAILGVRTDAELGFTPRKHSRGNSATTDPGDRTSEWHPAAVLATAEEMTSRDVTLSRRQALSAATTVAGAALTEPLQHWLLPTRNRFVGSATISQTELAGWHGIAEQFQNWNTTPTGLLARKAVLAQLNDLSDRLKDAADAPATRQAFLVGARFAEIAASMSWDAGLHDAAQRYYSLSVKFAKIGGDDVFAALTLAAFARQCYDHGQPKDGLELVQLAQYGTRTTAGPKLRSLLATREAWSYAHTGAVQPFRRAVGLAEDHFSDEDSTTRDEHTPGIDQAELYGVIGARWRDLAVTAARPKEARHAQAYIRRALVLRDPSRVRNRAFDLIGLARAHLVTAEPDRACELIGEALPIATEWAGSRVGAKLQDFYRESQPFATSSTVSSTREAICDVIAAGS